MLTTGKCWSHKYLFFRYQGGTYFHSLYSGHIGLFLNTATWCDAIHADRRQKGTKMVHLPRHIILEGMGKLLCWTHHYDDRPMLEEYICGHWNTELLMLAVSPITSNRCTYVCDARHAMEFYVKRSHILDHVQCDTVINFQ